MGKGYSVGEAMAIMRKGGLRYIKGAENILEITPLARFAVQEHNNKQNAALEFGRVLRASQQLVCGLMYHFTLEAIDGGKKKLFKAKVWEKSWMNFKQLKEFKPSGLENISGKYRIFFDDRCVTRNVTGNYIVACQITNESLLFFNYETPYDREYSVGFSGVLFAMKVLTS